MHTYVFREHRVCKASTTSYKGTFVRFKAMREKQILVSTIGITEKNGANLPTAKIVILRMMCYSVMTQAYSEKRNSEFSQQESTYDLPITSSDALPLSYRRLVGAKAIKLDSWDKHPAYC